MSKPLYLKMLNCLFLVCLTTALIAGTKVEITKIENEMLGDNFSLEGALEMFNTSETPEEFEAKINNESNNVNNLDLNEDGEVDYTRVIDNMEGGIHAFVLQASMSDEESQDIAVIEMEKTGDENVVLQIVGYELLYGENHIVESYEENIQQSSGGGSQVVNVWKWGLVQHVFRPNYRAYISPWRWSHYPRTWKSWRPVTVKVFRPRVVRHTRAYRVAPIHRVVRAHKIYMPQRKASKRVISRRTTVHNHSKVRKLNNKKSNKKKAKFSKKKRERNERRGRN